MEKKPFVTLAQVEEIAKTYPTPFYLYDEKGIRENVKRLKQAFAEVVPGTFVLVPDVMDHETGAIEPVPLITVLLPFVRDIFPGAIIFIETPTAIFLLPASLNCNGC